jgi:hypothetical protein
MHLANHVLNIIIYGIITSISLVSNSKCIKTWQSLITPKARESPWHFSEKESPGAHCCSRLRIRGQKKPRWHINLLQQPRHMETIIIYLFYKKKETTISIIHVKCLWLSDPTVLKNSKIIFVSFKNYENKSGHCQWCKPTSMQNFTMKHFILWATQK